MLIGLRTTNHFLLCVDECISERECEEGLNSKVKLPMYKSVWHGQWPSCYGSFLLFSSIYLHRLASVS